MKFAPFVALTVVFGALVAWFAPVGFGTAPAPAPEAGAEATAQLGVALDEPSGDGEVVLARAGDGHFYANVAVDGTATLMLVDTGASVVALTAEDAETLGIGWDAADIEQVARGANGPVDGVRITLDRMQLGDFEARSVEAVVVPEGLGVSLLGQSFLSQVPRVAMERDRMVLGG